MISRREDVARIIDSDPEVWSPDPEDMLLAAVRQRVARRREGALAKADAIIAALIPEEGWRGIETAPRDGTRVDLWVEFETGARRVTHTFYDSEIGEWWVSDHYHAGQYTHRPNVTHWRPLPEPPTLSAIEPLIEGEDRQSSSLSQPGGRRDKSLSAGLDGEGFGALGHDAAIDALCACAATVTVLSYQEVIEGYFRLRDLPVPA